MSGDKALKIEGKIEKDLNGKLTAYPMQHSVFSQNDVSGERWEVSTLKVKPVFSSDHDHKHPVTEARLRQRWKGIFSLEAVIARNTNGSSCGVTYDMG